MLRLQSAVFAGVLCATIAVQSFAAQKKAAPPKKNTQQPVEVTQPPPPPPTPEQMPAVQPRVSYQNGLLSIDAPNSSMTDVLNAVKRQTGANIDVPAGASGDRIVARLGPGKPKDVLASLLSGSRFNFIILGPPQNPDAVQRVILTRRQNAPAAGNAPAQQSMNPQVIQPPGGDEDADAPEEIEPDTPEEAPQPEATAPAIQPGQEPAQQQQGQGQEQNPNQPKTPEQLLQELQRMQQQQQQGQQQDQNQNQQQQEQNQNPNQQQPNPQQQMPPDRNPEDQ